MIRSRCTTGGRARPLLVDNFPVVPSDKDGISSRCLTAVEGWGRGVEAHTGSGLQLRRTFPNPQSLPLSLSFLNKKELIAGEPIQ
jgi:hypothetical protein